MLFGLSCMAIVTICTLNVQSSLNTSNEIGYSSLESLITLNRASAEEAGGNCTGAVCEQANGHYYNYIETDGKGICCGSVSTVRGDQKS